MIKKVFISGVFDCFHEGHEHLLKTAASYGRLFVAVNCDAYVRKRKGEGRPVDDAMQRMINVIQSGYVALVCINEEDSPLNIIKTWRPDYIVVGDDYDPKDVVGANEPGVTVVIVPRIKGISTTKIIQSTKP